MEPYKTFIISGIFVIMLCLITIPKAFAQHPSEDPTWQLVFNEEFDSLGINAINFNQSTDWRCNTYEVYDHKRDSCLPPFQTHRTKDNSNILFDTTGTGKLTIRTQRDTNTINSYSGCDSTWGMHEFYYTSAAWLRSNYRFKYGYFEVRCRLPYLEADETNYGVGPNFWLWDSPTGAGGICYSEIDIFEFLFYKDNLDPPFDINEKHKYSCCSHFQYCTDTSLTSVPGNFGGISFSDFHTFAALWTPDFIKYYMDDELVFTSTNHPSEMFPICIVLDVNLPTNWFFPIEYSLLPYDYEIDYVKVWQPRAKCDSSITCNFSAATYDNSIVNDVSIGGSGCTAIVNNTENVSFKAAEYIEFNQGFSVEPGGTMIAEITNCFTPVLNWWLPTKTSPEDEIPQGLIEKLFYPWEE